MPAFAQVEPGVGFVPARRARLPCWASFCGGNKHNDRKENLSLQATNISRLDWASTQAGFRGRKKTKKTVFFAFSPPSIFAYPSFSFIKTRFVYLLIF